MGLLKFLFGDCEKKKLEREVRRADDRLGSVQMRGVPEAAADLGARQMALARHHVDRGEKDYAARIYDAAADNYSTAAKEAKGMEVTRKMSDDFARRGEVARKSAQGV